MSWLPKIFAQEKKYTEKISSLFKKEIKLKKRSTESGTHIVPNLELQSLVVSVASI